MSNPPGKYRRTSVDAGKSRASWEQAAIQRGEGKMQRPRTQGADLGMETGS